MALNIYTKETDGTETLFLTVYPTDDSYHLSELQGKDVCEIKLEMAQYVNFPLGAYIYWRGEKYTLDTPAIVEKNGAAKLEYTLTFQGTVATLSKYITRHIVDGVLQDAKVKFSITAYPHEILQLIVDNLNYRDSGWTAGTCEPTDTVVLSFTQTTIKDALSQLATETECEYEVEGKTISIKKKVEYYKSSPLALQYGKGNGLRPGVGRKNSSDSNPMEVLFVQGGERNINSATYGSQTVLLPAGMPTLGFDGEHFSDEDGYNEENARTYKASEDRMSISRADKELTHATEAAATFDDVYPHREGTITSIVEEKENIIDFVDTAIPSTLDYKALTAEGQSLTVVFNSGMLCGKEFEVNYIASSKTFQLINTTIDGVNMPNDVWRPAVGDRYVVLNMYMPDEFLCDTENKAGAEWELFREAVKYMFDNEDNKFDFSGKLDSIYAHNNWENIGGKIKVGSYVKFTDPQFEADGVLLRIQSVKEGINDPYAPELTLSNKQSSASIASKIVNIEKETPYKIELAKKEAQNYAARSYAQVRETTAMLQEQFAALGNFDESISPLSVQTMQLIAGDESLQFEFIDSTTDPTVITPVISCTGGRLNIAYSDSTDVPFYLRHRTLGQTTMSTATAERTYLTWEVYNWESGDLDPEKPYYVYAHCPHDTTTQATFKVSDTAIAMDADADAYTLLLGFLNTAADADADRTFAQMYGYTEILPSRITTDKIVSADGNTYFDLVKGEIGGNIKFTATADNTSVINSIINNNTTVKNAQAQAEWAEQLADGASISADSAMADASNALSTANSAKAAVANAGLAGRNYALLTSTPITRTATTLHPVDSSGNYILDSNGDPIAWTLYFYQALTGNAACEKGTKITVSFDYDIKITEGSFNLIVQRIWYLLFTPTKDMTGHFSKTITLGSTITDCEKNGLVYLQGSFIGSCTISNFKWEIGSSETAWQPAPEDSQMLLQSLTDASKDKTTIYGGLVLSRYLGVKNSSGTIVAGMSGTDSASKGTLPMIWAGASGNTDSQMLASDFKVDVDGNVLMRKAKIVGGEGAQGMVIDNGIIKLGKVSNDDIPDSATYCKMRISPQTKCTTINKILTNSGVDDINLNPDNNAYFNISFNKTLTDEEQSCYIELNDSITLFDYTVPTGKSNGTLYFDFSGDTSQLSMVDCGHSASFKSINSEGATCSADIYVNSYIDVYFERRNSSGTLISKKLIASAQEEMEVTVGTIYPGLSVTPTINLSDYSTFSSLFNVGDNFKIVAYFSTQGQALMMVDQGLGIEGTVDVNFRFRWYCTGEVSSTIVAYNNHYFGNGYLLSSADKKYIATCSNATDGEIFRMRNNNAMVKFNTSGLLQSLNGGSSWFPLNPLAMVVYFYNGGNLSPSYYVKYNPRTLDGLSLARTATGTYTLTHKFGANHALLASGAASSTGSTLYMSVYSVASGTDKFVTSDDDTKNDFYCLWLFVFKFD